MSEQQNLIPTIVPTRFQVMRNPMLDGTSADMRLLTRIEYSTIKSSVIFELSSEGEQEYEYQPFTKPSAIIEELKGQSI
ncbi:MAG TPA: hypothetical protein VLX91_15720 [Candidatus Acidoferrales bacterium]|nr:hypothetical protein [Candidatus Acidoferrales bacterium]